MYNETVLNNTIRLLYVNNLSENKSHLSNFHNLEFAVHPGEIYGIYDFENLYSEVLVNSIIIRINKTNNGRLFFQEQEVTF